MPYTQIAFLTRLIELLSWYIKNYDASSPKKLFITAACSLGTDASPNDHAPDEFGCAETVDEIHRKALGVYILGTGPTLSTAVLYAKFRADTINWEPVALPLPGDVVISPTGYGTNPAMPSGHTGYIGIENNIMSNNSATGLFLENYTIDSWKARFATIGGYPVFYFRRK